MVAHERSSTAAAGTAQADIHVVEARELKRSYGEGPTAVEALRGVSLTVTRGHLDAVMGPSGSGKSTLMHTLAGLDEPTSGTVEIGGIEITNLDDRQLTLLRRDHVGFVFQFFNLLPMLSAEENVVLPLTIAGESADREWLDELLGRMGLSRRRSHRPSELSGGEQQRVAIARALATDPAVVIADEPTGNLDARNGENVLRLISDLRAQTGKTFVIATHDQNVASHADRAIRIVDGLLAAIDTANGRITQ